MIFTLEQYLIEQLSWPSWALRLIGILSVLVILTLILQQFLLSRELQRSVKKNKNDQPGATQTSFQFRVFQAKYLSVYLVTMLADWLQGTNMYTLYSVSLTATEDICYIGLFFVFSCFVVIRNECWKIVSDWIPDKCGLWYFLRTVCG
jgi:hypothetical protein